VGRKRQARPWSLNFFLGKTPKIAMKKHEIAKIATVNIEILRFFTLFSLKI